ncbi:MAG: hypothetical protein WD063_17325 [Pirellulales bacterium]
MHLANLNLIAALWDAQLIRWVVWVGLVVLTVALLLLVRTRWGQQKPLGKCVVLSLLAHLLLAIYMTTVNIVTATSNSPEGQGVHVAIVNGSTDEMADGGLAPDEWTAVSPDASTMPLDAAQLAPLADVPPLTPVSEPKREPPAPIAATKLPAPPPSEDAPPPELANTKDPIVPPLENRPQPVEMPKPDGADLVPPPEQPANEPNDKAGDANSSETSDAKATADPPKPSNSNPADAKLDGPHGAPAKPPELFQGRKGDHLEGGEARGATRQTEAAVSAALRWLAANQSANGRWDARRLGGGGLAADGLDRQAAGASADTGLTGLALLAFLASGHTHLEGAHRDTVRRGLEFLLASQDATGNLGATNNVYERMYCHAMATCALSEAYAMTGERRLLSAVRNAIGHTVRNQDRASGGWRYQLGQVGDTSQLGWQVMALKSAELGGIAMPAETKAGIERFLRSVASGKSGGLACYQPTRPIPTRSMTAEALVCRQFLGRLDRPDTAREASNFVLEELPGTGATNHYYWYYATLGLYQAGGDAWRRWNESLQKNLLATQRLDGTWAGSWDPDPVWGRSGGRVYSTALCALCLEVYYRYLPLYVQAAGRDARVK